MPDKVESIWDIERQLKDGQQLLALLAEVKAQILATPKVMLDYKGANGIAEAKAAAEQLVKTNNELQKSQEKLNNINVQAEVLRREKIKADKEQLLYEQAIQRERDKGASKSAAEIKLAGQLTNEYLQLNKALQDAELRYKNLYLTGNGQTQAAKDELKKVLETRAILDKVDKSLGNYQRNIGNYAGGFNGLNNSIQQVLRETPAAAISLNTFFLAISNNLPILFDELQRARKAIEAVNLATKEAAILARTDAEAKAIQAGATIEVAAAEGVLAQKTALANAAQVKTPGILSQIGKSLFSVQSALTAGVLILTLFGGKIAEWVGSLFKASDATSLMAQKTKAMAEVIEQSKSAFTKATMEVSNMKIAIQQAKEGMIKKEEVVKLYNDTLGKTTGYVHSLDEAETATAKNGQAYIQFTLLKAAAQIALGKAAEKAFEAEQTRAKKIIEFQTFGDKFGDALNSINPNDPRNAKALDRTKKNQAERRESKAKELEEDKKINENIAKDLYKQAEGLAKTYKFDYNAISEPAAKKDRNTKESTKALLDSDFELYKISQLRKIKLLQEGVDDERKTYDERIALLQDFSTESITLAKAQGKEDVRVLNEKLEAQQSNLKKAKGTERNNLLIEIANTQTAIAIANKKENDNELNIRDAHNKKFLDLEKQHNDLLKKAKEQLYKDMQDYAKQYGTDVQLKLEAEQFEKIKQLDIDFAAGRIETIKEYREKKAEIENQYNKKEINTDIVVQNLLLELAETNGKSEVEIQAKILELKKRLYELDTKNLLNEAEKKDAIRREEYDAAMKLGEQVEETAKSFFEGKFDREKNEIEESKRLIDEQTESKINNVNKELITEQEKANKITAIQALAAAKKQNLDNKQKEIDYKKAVFEKGVAIFDVIKNTAIAISKDLIDKKYLIPFDIAIGAAQVAAILARPIPKYEDGTESSKKGWALTDEAGPELYIKPDGSMEVGNDRPTLRYLEQGTKIIPHDEVNQYIMNRMMQSTAKALAVEDKKTDEIKEAILWGTKETVKALKKSKRTSVNIHLDSNFGSYIKKQVFE